jgi:hypothetical protein
MTKKLRVAGSTIVLAFVAGCAGTPTVQPGSSSAGYTPDILNYSAAKGGMLTEVIGNPFAHPKAELDAAVTETAAKSHFGQKVPFFTQAPEEYTSPYRVVFAMNPVRGTSAYNLCAGTTETRARTPKESDRVEAALCAREVVITSVKGSVAGPLGPRDPAFLSLIAQMSQALFPINSPERLVGPDNFNLF